MKNAWYCTRTNTVLRTCQVSLCELKENDPLGQFYRLLVPIGFLMRYYIIPFKEVCGFEVTLQRPDRARKC